MLRVLVYLQGALFYLWRLTINGGFVLCAAKRTALTNFKKKGEKEKGQQLCDKAIEMDPSLRSKRQQMGGGGL